MKKYNLKKLIKIESKDYESSFYLRYSKKQTFLGMTITKEGFYNWSEYLGTEPPENHILKDGKVLQKPRVIMHFESGFCLRKYFDTIEEADKFLKETPNRQNWIIDTNE
jgi:hypothetical protein